MSFDGISWDAGSVTFTGNASVFHQDTPTSNTELARAGTFGTDGGPADTVSLSGFSIGVPYRIQALVFDGRGNPGIPGRTVEFDGIDQGQYANGIDGVTWGDGLLVTGTFTADATTQDFTIEAFDGTTSKGGQLNALLVQSIPEPGTALLGSLGLFLLVKRRRR